jgi:ABC-type amino acid transport substrate-binding protein
VKSRCDGRAGLDRRDLLRALAGAAVAAWAATPGASHAAEPDSALERVRSRGRLVVGLYQDLPPFHMKGRGIDVALGRALAESLKVGFEPLPFTAGEAMDDDLRNMVWKGHYLGWGPADVLLHVPVDPPLMNATPQVRIFAPYYRERVAMAYSKAAFPEGVTSLAALKGRRVAVPGLSLPGWLLIGAEEGTLQPTLTTHFPDGTAAALALREAGVEAAAGLASELESVLQGDSRFVIQPLPTPRSRDGWAIGCAVKTSAVDLAGALQAAVVGLQADGRLQAIFQQEGVTWRL